MSCRKVTGFGLPETLVCQGGFSPYRDAAAALSGNDIQVCNDGWATRRFSMRAQLYVAETPIHGLLMWNKSAVMRVGPVEPSRWYYLGYTCQQCQQTFLVPQWVQSEDDLPRAMRHSCHGDSSADWFDRRLDSIAEETAEKVMRKVATDMPAQNLVNYMAQVLYSALKQLVQTVRYETNQIEGSRVPSTRSQ